MALADWLKSVTGTVTENLGTTISNAASKLFSGEFAAQKAAAEKATAELDIYKSLLGAATSTKTAVSTTPKVVTPQYVITQKSDVMEIIKKYWWVALVAVGLFFVMGALKKKSRVRRRRRRTSNPKPRRRRSSKRTSGVTRGKGRRIGSTYYPDTVQGRKAWSRAMRRRRAA